MPAHPLHKGVFQDYDNIDLYKPISYTYVGTCIRIFYSLTYLLNCLLHSSLTYYQNLINYPGLYVVSTPLFKF